MSNLERPILREDFDNMPTETYAGLGYATHRFADFIPVADDKDQYALRQSITDIGLLEPIVLFEGAILDGRHRYKACSVTGTEPRFTEFEGNEEQALQFVLAKNVARRQLSTVQKLTLREKLMPEIARLRATAAENAAAGGVVPGNQPIGSLAAKVGEMVGLSKATVVRADALQRAADENPDDDFIQNMVERALVTGDTGIKTAYESVSDALDREAKAQAGPSTAKQQATLISNIKKAADLLCGWDPGTLGDVLVPELDELFDWVKEAYERSL